MIKIPTIDGIIERRILINYVAEQNIIKQVLPLPFRPRLYEGKAIVGICLIRLKNIKPKGFPNFLGVNSENGAHRIAVEWDQNGQIQSGVYIPRRDTNLRFNTIVGGRLFPGKNYFAKFNVKEASNIYHIDFTSSDNTSIMIDTLKAELFDQNSIFQTLDKVSHFFEYGDIGYSPNGNHFDGLKLVTYRWKVIPLNVTNIQSSFFENKHLFPEGSIKFDNAILMENIEHEWRSLKMIK